MRRASLACIVVLVVAVAVLRADTVIFQDTFTEASNTNLVSHDPDIGGGVGAWAEAEDTCTLTPAVSGTSDNVRASLASGGTDCKVMVIATPTSGPATADYTVAQSVTIGSGTGVTTCAVIRYTDTSNYYLGCTQSAASNPDAFLYKKVSGTWTQLTTANCGAANGTVMTLSAVGTTISYTGAACNLSVTDSDLASAGLPGICWGDCAGVGTWDVSVNSTNDDFTVTELGGSNAKRLLLMGVGE